MGCRVSRTGATVIVVQPPDDPVKVRLRLRGDMVPQIGDIILAKLCEITDEFANRFEIESTEKVDVYIVKFLPMEGDEAGTVNRLCRKIINQAVGKGIPLRDNCKIIGAKEYQEAGDL
ncbi:uncharacterized protein LOC110973379 [Acanthaster planci]|uniref:Uncharacterized protein LOC110973379 n=1 Tax=Acanthaster planci TaxID=133434 RepID=A0A8B7XIU6_ACAPL|nr:uncharacterized protein LOC110973379 [Acanthaster planci]